jgi:hypothetical protein
VAAVVREFAHRHGLLHYDPQSGATSHPDDTRSGERLSLPSCRPAWSKSQI